MKIDIQKEREAFQKFCDENFDFERHEQTYFDEQAQCYENDIGEDTESINMAWSAWQAAKALAVPEGYIIVPLRDLNIVMELAEDHRNEYIRTSEFTEVHKAIHDVKAMIESQEPAND